MVVSEQLYVFVDPSRKFHPGDIRGVVCLRKMCPFLVVDDAWNTTMCMCLHLMAFVASMAYSDM